jgi:hypothetical protein
MKFVESIIGWFADRVEKKNVMPAPPESDDLPF